MSGWNEEYCKLVVLPPTVYLALCSLVVEPFSAYPLSGGHIRITSTTTWLSPCDWYGSIDLLQTKWFGRARSHENELLHLEMFVSIYCCQVRSQSQQTQSVCSSPDPCSLDTYNSLRSYDAWEVCLIHVFSYPLCQKIDGNAASATNFNNNRPLDVCEVLLPKPRRVGDS